MWKWLWLKSYPLILLLLCSVNFVYNSESWQIGWPGLAGGLVALGVIGLILLYKLQKSLQELWVRKGLAPGKVKTKYDKLVPVAIVLSVFHWQWHGRRIEGIYPDELMFKWSLALGDPQWGIPFVLALIAVVFLYKIIVLTNGLLENSKA